MAAPRQLSVIPDCGLMIELLEQSRIIDYTDSSIPWEYRIIENDTKIDDERLDKFIGRLSPIAKVTLSKEQLGLAGIPQTAETFAFMYPLEELTTALQRKGLRPTALIDDDSDINTSAVIMGGFVYFNSDFDCICVNALSKNTSKHTIDFAGPFEVNASACTELFKMKTRRRNHMSCCCVQSIQLDNFREAGFVNFAWVRPEEMFNFKPLFADHENMDGSLVYFREDGTGVGYAVVGADNKIDRSGYSGMLSNVFGYGGGHISSHISPHCHNDIMYMNDVKAWKKDTEHLRRCSNVDAGTIKIEDTFVELGCSDDDVGVDIFKLENTLVDKMTLLHRACHANLGFDFIKLLLDTKGKSGIKDLQYKHGFGWTPLHYACRFSPTNSALIDLLVTAWPGAVQITDDYGRYPLHIACDGNASGNVITLLLSADTSDEMLSLTSATPSFGLSPIHLACYQGAASEHILKALLLGRDTGMTSRRTVRKQLPLHLAILEKLPPRTVKILLDADSKYQSMRPRSVPDVQIAFDRRLPLHWACWNNVPCEIVELLLEKDESNKTSYQPAGRILRASEVIDSDDSNLSLSNDNSGLSESDLSIASSNIAEVIDIAQDRQVRQIGFRHSSDGIALHLALKHGRRKTIGLLLQEEMKGNCHGKNSSIVRKDCNGRIPLHIACQYRMDPQVIQVLLKLDQMKVTTHMRDGDGKGFSPLHYACKNKTISCEVMDILLDSEVKDKKRKKTASTVDRDLLYLAVRADAPDTVIARLLQPEFFSLEGFDEDSSTELAIMIQKSKGIQGQILRIMSDRFYFAITMCEFYANILAIIVLMLGSVRLREYKRGEDTNLKSIAAWLIIFDLVFLLREIVDYKSVGAQYFFDPWNRIEVLLIVLLFYCATFFLYPEHKQFSILAITGFLLIVQLILFLRTTFEPFARFVGGLLKIMVNLIPFLVISALLLLGFVYTYWILMAGCGDFCETEDCTFAFCLGHVFGQIHDFSLTEMNDESDSEHHQSGIQVLGISFGFFFIVILLSVVVALVDDIWTSTENESIQFLWESRVQKISQVQYLISKRNRHLPSIKFSPLEFIDNLHNVSYQSDVSWTKAPYDMVTAKDHYTNPDKYFDTDLARKIWKTKSLVADLYWAKVDKKTHGATLTFLEKLIIISKWVGQAILYSFLIVSGIGTFGVLWPKGFRKGFLSVEYSDKRTHSRKEARLMDDDNSVKSS